MRRFFHETALIKEFIAMVNKKTKSDNDLRISATSPVKNRPSHDSDAAKKIFSPSLEFFKALLDAVPLPLFFKDTEGRYQLVNSTFAATLGLSEEQIIGKTVFDLAPSDIAQTYHAMDEELLKKNGQQVYEHIVKDRSGMMRDVVFHKATIIDGNNGVLGIVGAIFDITKRRRDEQVLKASCGELDARVQERTSELLRANETLEREIAEHRRVKNNLLLFRELVNQSNDAIFVVDFSTARLLEVNDAATLSLGYTKEELLALRVSDIAEARTDDWAEHAADLSAKKQMVLEDRIRRKNNTLFPAEVNLKYIEHDGRKYIFAVVRDISLRKEMEHHIRITTEVLKLSSENISRQQYAEELGKLIKEWCNCSTATIRMAGTAESCTATIACSSFSGQCPPDLHIEHMTQGNCACFRALNGEMFPERLAVMTPGRSFFCADTKGFLQSIPEEDKRFFHSFCLIRKYGSVAVIPISSKNSVLGLIVFADEQKGAIAKKTVEVLESLSTTIAEALCRHNVEEELKQSREQLRNLAAHMQEAREQERINVAREIHDHLGQILTALKIDLSWMQQQCEGKDELNAKTKSMISLVNQTILAVKKIVTELRPSVLDHLGIAAAIEWQAGEVQKLTGIRCSVELRPEKIILETNVATNIFRVFQEIMTNVIRHADATEVRVLLENRSDGLSLEVADNGRGITEQQITNPASYGILGMRERVHFIGGTIDFASGKPRGSVVRVFVPSGGTRSITSV